MEIKYVKLQWQKSFAVTSTPETGDEKNAKGVAIIQVPSTVASHFNIPAVDSIGDSIPLTKVKTHKKAKVGLYLETGGAASGEISVEDFFRIANSGSGFKAAKFKTAVPVKAGSTNKRTTSIRFPRFFDLIMISQALGQMLKANKPTKFSVEGSKGTPIYYNDLQSPFSHLGSPINKGAWIITGEGVTVNTDELGQVAETTTPPAPPQPKKGT